VVSFFSSAEMCFSTFSTRPSSLVSMAVERLDVLAASSMSDALSVL
jgi:hypothetical protein